MASGSAQDKIIQSIKDSTNILVTVSTDPSVDELSAALGLTIFLNKLGKHATAVFSGKTPPAITFLEPDKTFEDTADSLRDFIIALDKEKADHLRYKEVDDAVKIFITPYKTTISESDLEFSQGDYNIELVLALNVVSKDHLDTALTAHGRILHDAEVMTVTAGSVKSSLGSTDWHEDGASGVSEMLVELIDGLKTPKAAFDEQMATALLTGIVASTDRFGNDATSSRSMTAAAELMAAGANQQLVAMQLAEDQAPEDNELVTNDKHEEDVAEVDSEKSVANDITVQEGEATGLLSINHAKRGSLDEVAHQTRQELQAEAAEQAEDMLAEHLRGNSGDGSEVSIEQASPVSESASAPTRLDQPSMGGTLNATTEQAAEDKQRELAADRNKVTLSHKYVGSGEQSFGDTPLNAAMGPSDEPARVDPFVEPVDPSIGDNHVSQVSDPPQQKVIMPLGSDSVSSAVPASDARTIISALTEDTNALSAVSPASDDQQSAMAAVDAALSSSPVASASAQIDERVASTDSSNSVAPAAVTTTTPTLADLEAGTSHALPPMPDFSTLPPLPPVPPSPTGLDNAAVPNFPSAPATSEPTPAANFDPAQFQIPGQK